MDLNEIRNKITDLLYETTAPQGEVWKAIHEIEDQYKAEIKQLQEDLHLAVDDVIGCKAENLELREKIASMQKVVEGYATDDVQLFCEGVNARLAVEQGKIVVKAEAQKEDREARKAKVKPEIINWSELTKKHRLDEDSPEAWADFIIVAAMTKKCPRGEFHQLFDLMERPTDRLEIAFTINDVQVPFMTVIKRFHKVVEDRVQSRLEEVLSERFSALDDFLDDAREAIRSAAQVKLGVKVTAREEEED